MIFTQTKLKAKEVNRKKKDPVLKGLSEKLVHRYYIGIDCGVNTGFACWDKKEKKLMEVSTYKIHEALTKVKQLYDFNIELKVRVEDARKRIWFGTAGKEQLQGAGSIKRDAKIWEDFLTDLGVEFELVAPKNNKTKVNADYFNKITGWLGKTNEHSRDAGMLVFGI
jgi:hypothetical protein